MKNTIITIDSIGYQTKYFDKIFIKGADYILAIKDNQEQLYQDIKDEFRFGKSIVTNIEEGLDHGRIEARKCSIITCLLRKPTENAVKYSIYQV